MKSNCVYSWRCTGAVQSSTWTAELTKSHQPLNLLFSFVNSLNSPYLAFKTVPFPQTDIIRAMVIVRRVRGKIITCNIVCNSYAQCNAHTFEQTWTDLTGLCIGFCLTGPMSLWLDSFLCMYYFVSDCTLHACVVCSRPIVAWWCGSGGIEAWSLGLLRPSVLWHYWLGYLTRKNPSPISPIMCLVGR